MLGLNGGSSRRLSLNDIDKLCTVVCRSVTISSPPHAHCSGNRDLIQRNMSHNSSIDPILSQSHDIDPELLDAHPDQEDLTRFAPEEEAVSRSDLHKPPSLCSTGGVPSLKLSFFRQGTSFPIS